MVSNTNSSAGSSSEPLITEQIVRIFNRLRQEQRCGMATKAAEQEMDGNQHTLIIEMLKEVDQSCKYYPHGCGVLVVRTVKEVLPVFKSNKGQIKKLIETRHLQLQTKVRELNGFCEKHNIRVMGEDYQEAAFKESGDGASGSKASSASVLVS